MHSVRRGRLQETRAYLLNIKGVASDAGSFRRDRWPDDRCVTETMASVQQSNQVVLVRNGPTQIALKMTESSDCVKAERTVGKMQQNSPAETTKS